jgi:hypothetical protein
MGNIVFGLLSACLLLAAARPMQAQDAGTTYTAELRRSVAVFGEFSRVYTDYGQDGDGYTFGGDYTFNKRLFSPSIEARFTHGGDAAVNQSDFMGGVKIEKGFRRFHPYLDGLVGYGTIHFGDITGYTHDNSITYDLGLGLDYQATRQFALKLDAQQQYWKLGTGTSELEPYNLSVGVLYRLPFGFHK